MLAGGGIKGGRVVGASDAKGEEVAERPVYPVDLIGTLYGLLGIDPNAQLPNPRGLEVNVLSTDENQKRGGILTELV